MASGSAPMSTAAGVKAHDGDGVDDQKAEIECVVREKDREHPAAGALSAAMGHSRPHEQNAGTSKSGETDKGGQTRPSVRARRET